MRHYDVRRVLAGMRRELEAGTAALGAAMRNQLLQNKVRIERMGRALERCLRWRFWSGGMLWCLMVRAVGEGCWAGEVGRGIRARLARGEIRAVVKKGGVQEKWAAARDER